MTNTLAASVYFLACCRTSHNAFCYCIEKPKLLNFYLYPVEFFFKNPSPECKYNHDRLIDHNLKPHNICTDGRAWSLDTRQQRQHFVDTVCGRIPLCSEDESEKQSKREGKKKEKPPAVEIKPLVAHEAKKAGEWENKEKKVTPIKDTKEDLLPIETDIQPPSNLLPDKDSLEDKTRQTSSLPPTKPLSEESLGDKIEQAEALSPKASDGKILEDLSEEAPTHKLTKPSDEETSEDKVEQVQSLESSKVSDENKNGDQMGEAPPLTLTEFPDDETSVDKTVIPPHLDEDASLPKQDSGIDDEGKSTESIPTVISDIEDSPKQVSQSFHRKELPDDKSQPKELPETPVEPVEPLEPVETVPSDKSLKEESTPSIKSTRSSEKIEVKELPDSPIEMVLSDKSLRKELEPKKSKESKKPLDIEEIFPPRKEELFEDEPEDVVVLTDELVGKLDRNLHNLETTFDKFVKKNRDFIQNLVECLNFEKQKKKSLEDNYNKVIQENEELKTKNDYLKMVNSKQLELFKNELDRGINENKTIYKRKVHLLERQLQSDQNELQMYKETERKYIEVVEQDNKKIEKLNNQIQDLKNKEHQLLRNYTRLLKFLEKVKATLSNDPDKGLSSFRYSDSLTDPESETDSDVKRVLKNALVNGIKSLNVRDISILHDAIQELNDDLCHQSDSCGKKPTSSVPDFSLSLQRFTIETSQEDISKYMQDYNTSSNLSIYPTRQMPDDRRVQFH